MDSILEQLSDIQRVLRVHNGKDTTAAGEVSPIGSNFAPSRGAKEETGPSPSTRLTNSSLDGNLAFEGASSLSMQSQYASRVLEEAVVRGPPHPVVWNVTGAMSSLDSVLNPSDPQSVFHETQFDVQNAGQTIAKKATLPPMDDIVELLRWAKGMRK